jgi:predicted metal-dependent peptidase
MVVEDRFVHEVLMMMNKIECTSCPTMGVSVEGTRIALYYNKAWVESMSDAELRFVITHEIYHIVLHHCTFRLPDDKNDRKLYNQAADLAINCLIPQDANRIMPTDEKGEIIGLLPSKFNFPDKLSMEQYVQLLRQKQNDDKDKGEGEGDGDDDGSLDDHSGWKDSEVIKQLVRNTIEKMAKDERAWGKMPGDVKAMILAAQQSQVSWERYLKYYLGNLVSPTQISTMKRPNKRYGYPYPGKKHGYSDLKMVAIDTSTSVGDNELAQFLCEVNKLAEIQDIDLVLFDSTIQDGPRKFQKKHASYDFKGRGGTNFSPVFKLASERRYKSVIILTDGGAPAPGYPIGVKDVLWVITGDGHPPVSWGERIYIIPKGQIQIQPTTQAA